MFKFIFIIILLIHGVIHLIGYFKIRGGSLVTKDIQEPQGIIWLLTPLILIGSALLFFGEYRLWWVASSFGLIFSQSLIFLSWKEAKFGSILNGLILIGTIIGFFTWYFEHQYEKDVTSAMESITTTPKIITESDLDSLPLPIQHYLRYSGVVNKEQVQSIKIELAGQMRERGQNWFGFTSEQYNFFKNPSRFFFMKAEIFGFPVAGYHRYSDEHASMLIKFLSLFSIVEIEGGELDRTETVTFFNDMCLMAPSALIDSRIQWKRLDSLSVKATFTNNRIVISAELKFNNTGQLIDFISDDRKALSGGELRSFRFSTPVGNYKSINGLNLMYDGEAIWHYPEGKFTYGKFLLKSILANPHFY